MPADTLQEQIVKYLTDVHGLEANAVDPLKRGIKASDDPRLTAALEKHLSETENLGIVSYRCLPAVAERAGDTETAGLAGRIVVEEQAAADAISELLESVAVDSASQTA